MNDIEIIHLTDSWPEQRVRTVDIAPTLARLLDLTPAEPLDGHPLTEVLP